MGYRPTAATLGKTPTACGRRASMTQCVPAPAQDGACIGPKRVAIVVTELRSGGAERVVVHLAEALNCLGVKTEVGARPEREGSSAEELAAKGVAVSVMGSTRAFDLASLFRLAGFFRRSQPDAHQRARSLQPAIRIPGKQVDRKEAHRLFMPRPALWRLEELPYVRANVHARRGGRDCRLGGHRSRILSHAWLEKRRERATERCSPSSCCGGLPKR